MDHQDGFWVERARRGDRAAFGLLVEKHTPMLNRLVNVKARNLDDTHDLIQEIWLQAYLNLDRLREPNKFASWLYGIAVNRTHMWLRRRYPQHASWDSLRDESYAERESYNGSLSDDPTDIWQIRNAVLAAIARLSAVNRDVVRLFYLDDLSYEQIAGQLHLPVKTVKSRLHKARQQLRIELQHIGEVPLPDEAVSMEDATMIAAHVYEVYQIEYEDASEPMFVVVLKTDQAKYLSIWIGQFEGRSIALYLRSLERPRPLTFDLMAELVERLGGRVQAVQLVALRETTYYALLQIQQHDQIEQIDCRPSDALALALRVNVPISVDADVLEHAGTDHNIFVDVASAQQALDDMLQRTQQDQVARRRIVSVQPLELKM